MNYENEKFEKELGYTSRNIMQLFKHFKDKRTPYERMWKLLDAIDSGKFWDLYSKVAPNYSIKPDFNYINYIKTNYTNSLYVGQYMPIVFPRFKDNSAVATSVNEFLEYQFDKVRINDLQVSAGESAALFNLGAIEIGWNNDIINGPEGKFIGKLEAKNIDVLSLYLDPATKDYLKGRAIFIEEEVPIVELQNESRFSERINEYIRKLKYEEQGTLPVVDDVSRYVGDQPLDSKDGSVRLLTCYYKYSSEDSSKYRIDKIWIIDNGYILNISKDIKPSTFPVRVLYANKCKRDPYGIPTTRLVMNSAMAVNIMDCADATLIGNSFKRGKVVSRSSGINESLFAKDGDNPNRLWVVDGDPNNLVRYIDPPVMAADRFRVRDNLEKGIFLVSGVDQVYTGRETNSVQTTGGMDILNQRLTMSDNTRIKNLQQFLISVAELIMEFFLKNGGKSINFPKYKEDGTLDDIISINFEELRSKDLEFDFTVNVSASTPINLHKLAEKADILLEKQMQYNPQPAVMTMEEWLRYQDFPQKYHILRRIKEERMRNDVEDIQSDIINYAGMVNEGMSPQGAVQQLAQERQLKREQPGLGNTASAGSFQARQG